MTDKTLLLLTTDEGSVEFTIYSVPEDHPVITFVMQGGGTNSLDCDDSDVSEDFFDSLGEVRELPELELPQTIDCVLTFHQF